MHATFSPDRAFLLLLACIMLGTTISDNLLQLDGVEVSFVAPRFLLHQGVPEAIRVGIFNTEEEAVRRVVVKTWHHMQYKSNSMQLQGPWGVDDITDDADGDPGSVMVQEDGTELLRFDIEASPKKTVYFTYMANFIERGELRQDFHVSIDGNEATTFDALVGYVVPKPSTHCSKSFAIADGNFETPTFNEGSNAFPHHALPGWHVGYPDRGIAITREEGHAAIGEGLGSQYLEFGGTLNYMSQELPWLDANTTYSWSVVYRRMTSDADVVTLAFRHGDTGKVDWSFDLDVDSGYWVHQRGSFKPSKSGLHQLTISPLMLHNRRLDGNHIDAIRFGTTHCVDQHELVDLTKKEHNVDIELCNFGSVEAPSATRSFQLPSPEWKYAPGSMITRYGYGDNAKEFTQYDESYHHFGVYYDVSGSVKFFHYPLLPAVEEGCYRFTFTVKKELKRLSFDKQTEEDSRLRGAEIPTAASTET